MSHRAYKAADKDGTGLIKRPQFRLLLMYIVYINSHWETLEAIVVGKDGQLDLAEFKRGIGLLGIDLGEEDTAAAFGDMDTDSSGGILFDVRATPLLVDAGTGMFLIGARACRISARGARLCR